MVLEAAAVVARRFGLDRNWLSDGVRDVMSPVPDDHPHGERIGPALVIEIASPDYVLAMKSMTTRKSEVIGKFTIAVVEGEGHALVVGAVHGDIRRGGIRGAARHRASGPPVTRLTLARTHR